MAIHYEIKTYKEIH